MVKNNRDRDKNKDFASRANVKQIKKNGSNSSPSDVTGILDERISNLREAIEEIDAALASRKVLNVDFLEQIEREAGEVKRQLKLLKEPWQMGFKPEVEFLRMSFHKSLTSRAKESRAEQLKYWENGFNLAKERRKFLDEYKALLATRRRLKGA